MNKGDISSNNSITTQINNDPGNDKQGIFSKFKIFPDLIMETLYEKIRIKNSRPIITDELIAKLVNEILSKINISDGSISWGYQLNYKKDDLKITFKWNGGSQAHIFTKTYRLNISKDV